MITRRHNLGDEFHHNNGSISIEPSTMEKSKASLINHNAEIRNLVLPRIGDHISNTFIEDIPISSSKNGIDDDLPLRNIRDTTLTVKNGKDSTRKWDTVHHDFIEDSKYL